MSTSVVLVLIDQMKKSCAARNFDPTINLDFY